MFSFKPAPVKVSTRPPAEPLFPVWLDIDYEDKDAARTAGARWDKSQRKWYALSPYSVISLAPSTSPPGPPLFWVLPHYETRKEAAKMGAIWYHDYKCAYVKDPAAIDALVTANLIAVPNENMVAYYERLIADSASATE